MSYRTKKCYDCHRQVTDIKAHRKVCPNSRYAKSVMEPGLKKHKKKKNFANTTDVYLLLDVSGSMAGGRLASAKTLLTNIAEDHMNEDDRMAIVSFDTNAYFKLKPRPVGQIRRQRELPEILNRIFAKGMTAIWDAIWMAVSQIRNKNQKTLIVCLTDGEDNSSTHSYAEVLALVEKYENISLSIVHVGNEKLPQYQEICDHAHGEYVVIEETVIITEVTRVFKKFY